MNTKRRASVPIIATGNGNNHMITEMKSWSRNKLEEQKLAQRRIEVDRHMASRRRTVELRQEALSREIQQNIRKTTPSLEEYLGRSQKRYHIWREREQDRLERRYRTLHRNYIKEYTQLLQDNTTLITSQHALFEDEDENNNGVKNRKPKRKKAKKIQDVNVASIENTPNVGDLEKTLSSIDLENPEDRELLLLNKNGRLANKNRRRASTGSIPLLQNSLLSSRASLGLPVVQEVMPIVEGDGCDKYLDRQENNNENENNTCDAADEDNNNNKAGSTDENVSEAITNGIVINDNSTSRVKKETGCRRSSVSGLDNVPTKRKSSDTSSRGTLRRGSKSPEIFIGRRLDRRPTLPNAAIPVIYGN